MDIGKRYAITPYRAQYRFWYRNATLPPSQKADILRSLVIIVSLALLLPFIDMSKIYHSIRGQETIKLYVIFNALEVCYAVQPLFLKALSHRRTDCRQAFDVDWTRCAGLYVFSVNTCPAVVARPSHTEHVSAFPVLLTFLLIYW